jgi:hypothetical protein
VDRKYGVSVAKEAAGAGVKIGQGSGVKDAGATTFAAAESTTAGSHVATRKVGEGADGKERMLDWVVPYHEVLRGSSLE